MVRSKCQTIKSIDCFCSCVIVFGSEDGDDRCNDEDGSGDGEVVVSLVNYFDKDLLGLHLEQVGGNLEHDEDIVVSSYRSI